MDIPTKDRREAELDLLQAMYPDLSWNNQRSELTLKHDFANLVLRLPDEYPGTARPIIITALTSNNIDCRNDLMHRIDHLTQSTDEECLDAILQAFEELQEKTSPGQSRADNTGDFNEEKREKSFRTVVIWLHHLLNTNKRKMAITPNKGSESIAGCSKPGYPGVLVYSGDQSSVDAHVALLRDQRWQAFQIRHDEISSMSWSFTSPGIKEVVSMAEVVDSIEQSEHKEVFLKAIGIK